jgi:hypothetical protein
MHPRSKRQNSAFATVAVRLIVPNATNNARFMIVSSFSIPLIPTHGRPITYAELGSLEGVLTHARQFSHEPTNWR